MPGRIHGEYDGEMIGSGDYGYAAGILLLWSYIHGLCTLHLFCFFELLSQKLPFVANLWLPDCP